MGGTAVATTSPKAAWTKSDDARAPSICGVKRNPALNTMFHETTSPFERGSIAASAASVKRGNSVMAILPLFHRMA